MRYIWPLLLIYLFLCLNTGATTIPSSLENYLKNGCFEKARDELIRLSQSHPRSIEFKRALARAYLFMAVQELWKAGSEADLEKIKQILSINTNDPISLYYLGKVELLLKNKREALNCFKKALLIDPNYVQAALDLALLYEAQGNYTEAKNTIEKLIKQEKRGVCIAYPYIEELLKRFSWEENFLKVPQAKLPLNLIKLPKGRVCLLVDKEKQRLLLYLSTPQGLLLKHIFPCTTGRNHFDKFKEGDNNTPEGVYFFTKVFDEKALAQIGGDYGNMAFVLDYPNIFDRFLNKDGHGIWLHGTNKDFKPWLPQATHGCVVMNNVDLLEVSHNIHLAQTPIIITKEIKWVSATEIEKWQKEITAFLNKWKEAWANKDFATYEKCYHPKFRSGSYNRQGWINYKKRLAKNRKHIEISLDNVGIYFYNRYPQLGQVVMVRALQTYRSDAYEDRGIKTLFLVKKDKSWQILLEKWQRIK